MKQSLFQGNTDVRPNRIVFRTYTIIGLIYCSLSAWIFQTVSQSTFLTIVHSAAFFTFLGNYIYLTLTKDFALATKIFLAAGLGVVTSLFATGGWEHTGYLWPLVYLVFVFFITDGNTWRWIIYFYSACILVVLLSSLHIIRQPYTVVETISYFAALGVITIFIYYFQKALNNYEAFLSFTRNLFEGGIDPFFTLDSEGRITDANKVFQEITGIPLSQLIGSDFSQYFADPAKAREMCRQVLTGGPVRNYPLELRHFRDDVITVVLNATIYSDKRLKLERIFAIARDITEQKKAEDRLTTLTETLEEQVKQKTAELAMIFERVTVPFIALDRHWQCTYINSRAEKVLNTTRERLIGRNIWEEFPQDPNRIYDSYLRAYEEQRYVHSEDYSTFSGRWFESDIYPSPDGISVFFNEITQQKETEQALLRSQEKTQMIIDSALDAIICIDIDSRIIEWNPRAELIFGWQKTEALGRTVTETIIPEAYRTMHEEGMKRFLRTGDGPVLNRFFEISALRRDGSAFPIEITIAPIIRKDDRFFCAFIRDITPRKKAEEELQQLNLTLKEQAAALAASNIELEQFAFLASHDLQEPLRTISGFIAYLKERHREISGDKTEKALDMIFDSSERMRILIKDLLDYSRIGKNRQIKIVDCNIILRQVLTDLGKIIEDSGATISSDPLPILPGYPTELKLLFQNLISNSLKFSQKDTPPATRITVQQQKEGFWEFSIQDNGIGIDETNHQKIFDIFKRLHPQSVYQGSGIGLAHCRKIVEVHGGKIWVESALGKGSTFHFTLPA